jgi:hypothetical protein
MTRGGYVRGSAEYLGGTRVRFTWPCGHTETKDFSTGPVTKRIGAGGVRFLSRYWGKDQGGVNLPPCRRCVRPSASRARREPR